MLLRHVHNTSPERDMWHKLGAWVTIAGAALAFAVWLTVRSHPEQDLPFWPAWVFTTIGCIGLALLAATSPHRQRRRHEP
jgi:hypothetical protein